MWTDEASYFFDDHSGSEMDDALLKKLRSLAGRVGLPRARPPEREVLLDALQPMLGLERLVASCAGRELRQLQTFSQDLGRAVQRELSARATKTPGGGQPVAPPAPPSHSTPRGR